MPTLKRKQIYLDIESDRQLKQLAQRAGLSEAELIRRAVKEYLCRQDEGTSEEDPILQIIGLCPNPEGPTDASVHHDRYLYGSHEGS